MTEQTMNQQKVDAFAEGICGNLNSGMSLVTPSKKRFRGFRCSLRHLAFAFLGILIFRMRLEVFL